MSREGNELRRLMDVVMAVMDGCGVKTGRRYDLVLSIAGIGKAWRYARE